MDVPSSVTPTEKDLQAAFDAQDVTRFEQLIKRCGKREISLVQVFTNKVANDTLRMDFLAKLRYKNMLLIGLRRIIELSSPARELDRGKLDLDWCLVVINKFTLESNVSEILTYANSEGFTFLYFLTNFARDFAGHEHEKIRNVQMALEKKILGQINSHTDVDVLKAFVKSGVMRIEDSCERLLTLFPEQKVEEVFADIPVLLSRDFISLAVFKIFFKQNKIVGFENLYNGLWRLIIDIQDNGYRSCFDKFKFIVEKLPEQKLDCVELFRKECGYVLSDAQSLRVVAFIVEHKLTDYYGLRALLTYLDTNYAGFSGCKKYLSDTLERVVRQVAVTVGGINRFRNRLFPVDRYVVQEYILPAIADRRYGFSELKHKLFSMIEAGNEAEVKRLITCRNINLNAILTPGTEFTLFCQIMMGRNLSLSMTKCLVEECGARVTERAVTEAGEWRTENGRYLVQKLREAEVNIIAEPDRESPAP